MTVVERIQSKREKIAKLNALIERKRQSIAKTNDAYRRETLEGEISDRQKDIKYLEREIEELKPLLKKFNDRQEALENLRKVLGVFMDDLEKSWNEYDQKMLDSVTPRHNQIAEEEQKDYQKYYDKIDAMTREEASIAYEPYARSYFYRGISESQWERHGYQREYICKCYANGIVEDKIKRRMVDEFGVGYGKYIIHYGTNKEEMMNRFRKENHDTVESLVLDLQSRITYKVGEITDYSNLHVGMKALNGTVTGTIGRCRVESILAGGYNIQRLHVRVLVK